MQRTAVALRLAGYQAWLCWLLQCALVTVVACKPASHLAEKAAVQPRGGGGENSAAIFSASTTASSTNAPATLEARFIECAQELGLCFTYYNDEVKDRFFLPEVMGGGLAWLDYDADGVLDLYACNGCQLRPPEGIAAEHRNQLFRGLRAATGEFSFVNVTLHAGQADDRGFGQGCAVGDYDADGFPDLYVTNYGSSALLHNNGDGTFDNVILQTSTDNALWGTSAVWLDVNDDEWLDLYVVNYLDVTFDNLQVCQFRGKPGYCGPGEYHGQPDRVFINGADGRFQEMASALGLVGPNGKGLAVVAVDLDDDGKPEIYVGNDMTPNFLFTRSRPHFVVHGSEVTPYWEIATAAGCAVSDTGLNEATMGIAVGDFNRDGMIDIFLSHFYQQKNTLYTNLGGLLFKDDSRRTRIAATSYDFLGFGTVALDADSDGHLDLFVANGHVLGPYYDPCQMTPQLLRNDGTGRFDDVSAAAGDYFHEKLLGRGVAAADFDQDGDLDIAISHLHRPLALLRLDVQNGHYFGLSLTRRNRLPPAGARVEIVQHNDRWTAPYVVGGSYLSSNDPRLLIRLPTDQPVDLTVYWPDGQVEKFHRVPVDQYVRVIAGEGLVRWPVFAP